MNNAHITILMPVYNGERYLRETMDSIFAQTYQDYVLLIINDGSTDATRDIVMSYNDERIQLVDNEQNLGLVRTLNKGIGLVTTEYLARMDADDLWHPEKLQKQIDYLDSHPDCGLCGTSIHKFGDINADMVFPVDNDGLKVGFLFYCMMSHPSVIFRMSMLQTKGLRYRPDYYPAEDYKMWTDCLRVTEIHNIPEPLVLYRQHGEQICRTETRTQAPKTQQVAQEMLLLLYPQATKDEITFHFQVFVAENMKSKVDFLKCKNWCKTLELANRSSQYTNPKILHDGLQKWLQGGYLLYIRRNYFPNQEYSLHNYIQYFLSFDWIYLSLKRQIKILLRK